MKISVHFSNINISFFSTITTTKSLQLLQQKIFAGVFPIRNTLAWPKYRKISRHGIELHSRVNTIKPIILSLSKKL